MKPGNTIHRTVLGATLLLAAATAGLAQTTVSTMSWSPAMKPVVLGSGLYVTPGQINVVNQGLTPPTFNWQNEQTDFKLLDCSSVVDTMSKLNLNAWGEVNGFLGGGGFSVDFTKYQAFYGNHRHWKVDARRLWTAFVSNPTLNATALKTVGNAKNFQNMFGNYAVTGINYKRVIDIDFDATFSKNVSSEQMNTAISASYGGFSGGVSADAAKSAMSCFDTVSISITVEGQDGNTLLASGASGDLDTLRQAVQQQLASWDNTPKDANSAGNIDSVNLTPYTAITPAATVTAQPGPSQIALANAISTYVSLTNAELRLGDIQFGDSNLNPQLYAYLFGQTDSQGNHILNTGKLDEVTADLNLQYAYMQSLARADGKVADPQINFHFDDPDVVQWRVLQSATTGSTNYLDIEIYSNARVSPKADSPYALIWYDTAVLQPAKQYSAWWSFGSNVVYSASYSSCLDPVTGIPHRYAVFYTTPQGIPVTATTLSLISEGGNTFINATDWNGWPTPSLYIPTLSFGRFPGT